MKAVFMLAALLVAGLAHARPVIIEDTAVLEPPDGWRSPGRFGVAIDGDWALVSLERQVTDAGSGNGIRYEGAAGLYRFNGSSWAFSGLLGSPGEITQWRRSGLAMKGGVAMVITDGARIFERNGTTWSQAPLPGTVSTTVQGPDIEIDQGRILVGRITCSHDSVVLRKLNGSWQVETELTGHSNSCGDSPPSHFQDLHGGRAAIFNRIGLNDEPAVIRMFRLNAGGQGWQPSVLLDYHADDTVFGPEVALNDRIVINTGSRERGTNILHEVNQTWSGNFFNTLQPADGFMQQDGVSATALERAGRLFAQQNFSWDRNGYVINLFRVNYDLYFSATHVGQLQLRNVESVGERIDASGNRVIANGQLDSYAVRIWELPPAFQYENFNYDGVEMHDFEGPAAGATWTPLAGSAFSVQTSGNSRVFRQASTAGDAAAWLADYPSPNQSIQAEITPRSFNGNDRWVGLMTRRTDGGNFYYATLRSSGSLQFRRVVNGVVQLMGSTAVPVQIGRTYRLRLESIGSYQRVFLDDELIFNWLEESHKAGVPGIAMYRASADYDNVVVTPDPFTTIYQTDFGGERPGPAAWSYTQGDWRMNAGVYTQASLAGDARTAVGAMTDDQIVRVRVRPTGFNGTNRWAGLLARWENPQNYLYVSLRNNNTVSLRRVVQGNVQELASAPLTVNIGRWYDVRLEIVKNLTRVYVDGRLMLSSSAAPGPNGPNPGGNLGRIGLVTYRASADYDDLLAYQP
jgi:hypothetical protein